MDQSQARDLIALIPFRALLNIARALGGVGADPHRLPGGKQGLADALIARYGADKILAQWQAEKSATPPPAPHTPHDATPSEGETGGSGHAPGQDGPKGEGEGPQGDGPQGDGPQGDGAPSPSDGEGDGKGEPEGAPSPSDATPTPAEGESEPQDAEKGESEPAPAPCPSPDAPEPAPEKESPMDAAIREIARQEAERAVYPVAQWANEAMLPAFASLADAVRRNAAKGSPQGEMEFPPEGPRVPLPAVPRAKMPKGAAIQHHLMPKLLALIMAGAQPLLVGPAGTGKSHAARAVADALGRQFGSASLSAGVSESALMGWLLPVGESGRFDYVPAPFVTLYEAGNSVFLMDEIDAASPDMLVIANSALANGGFTVPQRFTRPYVAKGPDGTIIAAANTVDGADEMYQRIQMDGATLNRFYLLRWDHDAALERSIAGLPVKQRYWTPQGLTEWTPEQWAKSTETAILWVEAVRKTIKTHALPRIFSVRQTVMYQQGLRAGCTHKEIRADLLMAWGPDEVAKLPQDAQPVRAPAVGAEIPGA